jgi:YD repeat-containing protein
LCSDLWPADPFLFSYDSSQRVVQETVEGLGDSQTSGGQGTYSFSYTSTSNNGYNAWTYKNVETLPDSNQQITYTNFAGEVMLSVYYDVGAGQKFDTWHKYDSLGRLIMTAEPSAVTGYNDTYSDLLNYNNQTGLYQYLANTSGLIEITDWGTSTTATSTTAGDVKGFLKDTKIEQGQQGTAILTGSQQYYLQTANSVSVYPIATETVCRNTNGTGGETTSYSYTFFTGTVQVQSVTTTYPTVTSGENGPGTADVEVVFNDNYARPIWTKDADGFIDYVAYDPATGAATKTITDVDTTKTGDFQNLPNGWTTPSGGGLHLISSYIVDGLGRPTKTTDPIGNVSYTVYLDTNYEVRAYPGWTGSATTGPTEDYREDRVSSYFESLTMTATPHTTNGVPDGTEAISNVQTLSRQYISAGGQEVRDDDYFNLSGLTYSVAAYFGTQNTNYFTSVYGYDNRGRQVRTLTPNGTIYRTVYDGQSRELSTWVGTNDTPPSGEWSPTNNGSPSNMVQITGNVYDGGGVGDSDLTQVTEYPGGTAANRVSQMFYDWRDRLVATKSGVQASEERRPLTTTMAMASLSPLLTACPTPRPRPCSGHTRPILTTSKGGCIWSRLTAWINRRAPSPPTA